MFTDTTRERINFGETTPGLQATSGIRHSSRFTEDTVSQKDPPVRHTSERCTEDIASLVRSEGTVMSDVRDSFVEVSLVDALQSLTVIVKRRDSSVKIFSASTVDKGKSNPSLWELSSAATFNSKTFLRVHDRDSLTIGCNVHDRYELEEMLGEGAYGAVWAARERTNQSEKRNGRCVAVKKMPYGADIHREVLVLKTVDHPGVARLYEVFDDGKNLYMVLEKCDGGELLDRIMSTQDPFDEDAVKRIMRQLTSALTYCHKRNIIHRDIKPENILFCTSDSATWVKLVDFGLALGSSDDTPRQRTGTEIYSAPELHASKVPHITSKADMWAVGCVLFSMLSGHVPFAGANAHEAIRRGTFGLNMEGGIWDSISSVCKGAIRGLLHVDPVKRWSAEDLLTSSWLVDCYPPLPPTPHWLNKVDTALADHVIHLCSFVELGVFRRVCLGVVARHMDWTHSGRFIDAFYRLDVDGDGMISRNDWEQVWTSVMNEEEYNKEDAEMVFRALNLSASGGIEYSEYLAACVDQQVLADESVLWSTFSYFGGSPEGSLKFSSLEASIKRAIGSDDHVDLVVGGDDYLSMGADIDIEFNDFKLMLQSSSTSDMADSARCVRWNDDVELRTPSLTEDGSSTAAPSENEDGDVACTAEDFGQLAISPPAARYSGSSRMSFSSNLGLPIVGLRRTAVTVNFGRRGATVDPRLPIASRFDLHDVSSMRSAATHGKIGHPAVIMRSDFAFGTRNDQAVSPVTARNGRCTARRKSSVYSIVSGRIGEWMQPSSSSTRSPPPFSPGTLISSGSEWNVQTDELTANSSTTSRNDFPLSLGLPGVRSASTRSRPRGGDPSVISAGGLSSGRVSQPLSLGLPFTSCNRTVSKPHAGDVAEISTSASSSSLKSDPQSGQGRRVTKLGFDDRVADMGLPIDSRAAALIGSASVRSIPTPGRTQECASRADDAYDDVLSPLGIQDTVSARRTRYSPVQSNRCAFASRATQVSTRAGSVYLHRIRSRSIFPPDGEFLNLEDDTQLSLVACGDDSGPTWRTLNCRSTRMSVRTQRPKTAAQTSESVTPVSSCSPMTSRRKTRMVYIPRTPKPDFDYYGMPIDGCSLRSPRKDREIDSVSSVLKMDGKISETPEECLSRMYLEDALLQEDARRSTVAAGSIKSVCFIDEQ